MTIFPRAASVSIPITVALFAGLAPQTGQAGTLSGAVYCLDNGTTTATGISLNAAPSQAGSYYCTLSPGSWRRGTYRCVVSHVDGRQWATDFAVGTVADRKLGYAASYGAAGELRFTLWVEEDGEVQTDYTSLTNITLAGATGDTVANIADIVGADGLFAFVQSVTLTANSHYTLTADAVVPGPVGKPELSFKLRIGIARP